MENFKAFMGEAEQVPWTPTKEYRVPYIKIAGAENKPRPLENSILDYMGIPTKIKGEFTVNALPVRAYVKIWNEYFRDQNVDIWAQWRDDDTFETYTDNGDLSSENTVLYWAISGGRCLPVNKFHDYFTSCLPYPQKGPDVALPLGGNAPVGMYKDTKLTEFGTVGGHTEIYLNQTLSGSALAPKSPTVKTQPTKDMG